jgi:methionine transaminase
MIRNRQPFLNALNIEKINQAAIESHALNMAHDDAVMIPPESLTRYASEVILQLKHQYCPAFGLNELRTAISDLYANRYSRYFNPDNEITVTNGATQAIYCAITASLSEGDEAIVFEPANPIYVPAIECTGAKAQFIPLKRQDFSVNWEEIQKAITSNTKLIIINSPHNPSGKILSSQDLEKLQKIVSNTKINIISDEVSESIIFENYEHQSIARFPKLAERSFIISSFGKVFNISNWKLGYCIAPEKLMHEFRKIVMIQSGSTNSALQFALARYLNQKADFTTPSKVFQHKRDYFSSLIKNSKLKIIPPLGGYYLLIDYSDASSLKDIEFAAVLLHEHHIATLPLSHFCHEPSELKLIRISLAKSDEELEKAAAIFNSL